MKQFSRISGLALLLVGSVLFATAQAQEFRLGSVNVDRVMREAVQAKSAQAKLEQEFSRRDKELQEQGSSLKGMAEKFEREAPTLSESQRTARQRQLVDLDRDFQRKRREFQEDLNLRKNEELQQVLDRANRVVRQLADNEKYDLILNAQDIVYVNPRHDITDKVIRALNASK